MKPTLTYPLKWSHGSCKQCYSNIGLTSHKKSVCIEVMLGQSPQLYDETLRVSRGKTGKSCLRRILKNVDKYILYKVSLSTNTDTKTILDKQTCKYHRVTKTCIFHPYP